jgi:hypothetical protein
MKQLGWIAFVGLLCVAAPSRSPGDGDKPPKGDKAPAATVILTDVVTGMSRLDEKKVEYRLSAAKGQRDPLTAPHVLVDENKVKLGMAGRMPVAFQGRLTTKEVVVGMTGSIPPRKITATGLYLIVNQATPITDDNKAKFPPAGLARIQGKPLTGKFPTGDGEGALHAIANGDHPILLLDKDGKALRDVRLGEIIIATGRLRIAPKGTLILHAETIEEKKGEK